MKSLIVHQEKIDPAKITDLIGICPFGAIEESGGIVSVNAACRMCGVCTRKGIPGAMELVETREVSVDKTAYKGIAVFVDNSEGSIHPVTYELLGKARELAKVIGHPVYAVFIGSGIEEKASRLLQYGADEVFISDHPGFKNFNTEDYAAVFEHFILNVKPSSLLFGATNAGRSLAPRLAARFRTGLTADCTVLSIKENTDLVQIRPAFGGNIMAQIVTGNSRPQFCTVRYRVFEPQPLPQPSGKITKMNVPLHMFTSGIKVGKICRKAEHSDLSEAEIIVAVGRGFKTKKDLAAAEEFAHTIGARIACTRPLTEAGWFDPRLQIGLSGRTVKPKLIICLGISGSVQFAAGMNHSGYIVAVNRDAGAPIFNIAHLGLIGNIYDVLPELMERIKRKDKDPVL